ncbi:MAG: hypothetical protein GX421_03180 [Caldisericales bacterium]|nr:hypothetical protein [Caldisericales bacterium]
MKRYLSLLIVLCFAFPVVFAQETAGTLIKGGIAADKLLFPKFVQTDREGNFYVYCKGTNELCSYSRDLKLRYRTGGSGTGPNDFVDPADLVIFDENIVISDVGSLLVFDLKGNFKKKITKIGNVDLKRPLGLSTDSRKKLYVSDPEAGSVLICGEDFGLWRQIRDLDRPAQCHLLQNSNLLVLELGTKKVTILSSFYSKIKSFGEFISPHSVWTDASQKIVVLDDDSIKIFGMDSKQLEKTNFVPKHPGEGYCPFVPFEDGYVFASFFDHEIVKVGKTGKISVLVSKDDSGLFVPSGLDVDANGRIYVADEARNAVMVMDQKGNQLFSIETDSPKRITIGGENLAIVKVDGVEIRTRAGEKLFSCKKENVCDSVFGSEDSILVLTGKGEVVHFRGSFEVGMLASDPSWKPVAISAMEGHFAVAVSGENRIIVFSQSGIKENVIDLADEPSDFIMLSPQRFIVLFQHKVELLDKNGFVMKAFGRSGGIRSSHKPVQEQIDYSSELDRFTRPVAVSRFGNWLYVLDKTAMRLVRFPKELLLAPPVMKIMPELVDFGVVKPDTNTTRELVIQNLGGESLAGSLVKFPKWISISPRTINGDDVVIKVTASTAHFMAKKTYIENIIIETNAGSAVVPCKLLTPDELPKQINIELKIGQKTAKVGGKTVDLGVAPFIDKGATMVPLRFLSEAFGGNVSFDEGFIDVSFDLRKIFVSLQVGFSDVAIEDNGETKLVKIAPPPVVKQGKTFVPLKFFTDILDCEVYWDSMTKQLRIVYTP